MGLRSLKWGETIPSSGVERYRGSKNVNDIVAIPIMNVQGAHINYLEGLGYFYNLPGSIMSKVVPKLPSTKYIVPIVQYTSRDGINDYGAPVTMKYLSLNPDGYESDLMLKQEIEVKKGSSLDKMDLLITCTDDQYQKLTFQVLGPSVWRMDKAIAAEVKKLYREYVATVEQSVARVFKSEAEFIQAYEQSIGPISAALAEAETESEQESEQEALPEAETVDANASLQEARKEADALPEAVQTQVEETTEKREKEEKDLGDEKSFEELLAE